MEMNQFQPVLSPPYNDSDARSASGSSSCSDSGERPRFRRKTDDSTAELGARRLGIFTLGAAGIAALVLAGAYVFPDDPGTLLRYAVLRLTGALIGILTLSAGMLFVDYITPHNWMENIAHNETACAIVIAAVVLVLGAILCWS
jgi:hypothetical protein